jgi:CRISPR/Cas system CSM-associated protein Csm2 small subunit
MSYGGKDNKDIPVLNLNINSLSAMEIVKKVMDPKYQIQRQIKSETSYRRIHELLAGILDSSLQLLGQPSTLMDFMNLSLAKARVIVEYQSNRDLISDKLKNLLVPLIDQLITSVQEYSQEKLTKEKMRENIEKVRIAIDSIAVLAKLARSK